MVFTPHHAQGIESGSPGRDRPFVGTVDGARSQCDQSDAHHAGQRLDVPADSWEQQATRGESLFIGIDILCEHGCRCKEDGGDEGDCTTKRT